MRKIRLFLEEKHLHEASKIKVSDNNFEYLTKVMRQKIGDRFYVFNGIDGEFSAEITAIEKKSLSAKIHEKISDVKKVPNITLAFAPVKNVKIDFVAEISGCVLLNFFQICLYFFKLFFKKT